jgi:hypothetical protein
METVMKKKKPALGKMAVVRAMVFAKDVDEKAANEELTRFNSIMVDRELRIIELKKQVNELCVKAGLPARYKTDFEDEVDGVPNPGKQV